jgi:hypothetical protein
MRKQTNTRAARGARAVIAALALTGAVLLFIPACKTKVPADIPGQFSFHGFAIHPAAVSALYRSSTGLLDLAAFKTNLEAREWEDQFGWWVTDFEQDPTSQKSAFFAYTAFAGPLSEGSELYIVSITFNAGESADVDNILLIQKSGTWLGLLRSWEEGSACDGGILSQRMEGDNFLYSRELTPLGLLDLAPNVRLELNAHEDLEATGESCYAAANFVYSLTQDREDLASVRLYDEPVADEKGRTERFRHQSCFNRIFNDYLAQGKKALSPKDLDEFAARFRDECVNPDGSAQTGRPVIDK